MGSLRVDTSGNRSLLRCTVAGGDCGRELVVSVLHSNTGKHGDVLGSVLQQRWTGGPVFSACPAAGQELCRWTRKEKLEKWPLRVPL